MHQKQAFFEETHQFYCNCPRMKDNIAGRLLFKTSYQVKFLFLSYSPNFSLPIRLQDFLNIKACVCYFLGNFCFSPNDSPWKTMKNVFISSKKLFSFLRYLYFCIFVFPSFFPVSHCFRGWSKKNLKIYDVINCLNKNLTHFVWYLEKEIRCDIETLSIDRVLNKEHFYGEIMQKMCTKS